ncbi:hypothetical protein MUK42_09776 [Musa troglodytarum]|uniref:Uncharacterized protein n=1 Tax=Musa troglodytarum TaxID=320322 RepID=A0A9E7EA27_9LILI|nr:hypothetical protein MUK42_09776 [Musa troglodytarum]
MEETPPSSKILAASAAGSPAELRAVRHRVRSRTSSLSGSASSLSSSSAATSPSASPSPCSSSVPFSWEQRPGIPKAPPLPPAAATDAHLLLPLPPPARSQSDLSTPRKKRPSPRAPASPDPFAAALALCAKGLPDVGDEMEELWAATDAPRRVASMTDRFRLFDLYGSCKATCPVVEATVRLPRARSFGSLARRPGSTTIDGSRLAYKHVPN